MKATLLFVVVTLVALVAAQEYVPSYPLPNESGYEVIFTNETSFFDQIDYFHGGMYVAGAGYIHKVNEYPTFNLSYWPYFNARHSFLDFKTFVDGGNTWAVGTIGNQHLGNHSTPGLHYPLYLAGTWAGNQTIGVTEELPGFYLMSSVSIDNSTTGQPVAYFVGWHQHFNASEGVNLTLIRVTINTNNAVNNIQPVFQYNHTGGDRVYLHGEDYVAYGRNFKPWLFHSEKHNHLVVVDPATNSVFRVYTPLNTTEDLFFNTSSRFRLPYMYHYITGATYDRENGHVYLGIAGYGAEPGMIVVVDVFNMTEVKNYTLGNYMSNPKSLALSWSQSDLNNPSHLYVGLYGTTAILRLSLTSTEVKVATLPVWVQNVFGIQVTQSHVYFVTNEQFSKVGRIGLANFCGQLCDWMNGYCNNQSACACIHPYMQIGSDGRHCEVIPPTPAPTTTPTAGPTPAPTPNPEPTPTHGPTPSPTSAPLVPPKDPSHGGEVALGILFAIAVVAAAVGWFLLYRARGGRGIYNLIQ